MNQDYVFKRANALLQRNCVNHNSNQTRTSSPFLKSSNNLIPNLQNQKHQNNNSFNPFQEQQEQLKQLKQLQLQQQQFQQLYEQKQNNKSEVLENNEKERLKIDKEIFRNVEIIGNSYNKAIICFNQKSGVLFGLDQHAIHERIRYEYFCYLLKQYILQEQCNNTCKIDSTCVNLSNKNNTFQYPSIISFNSNVTTTLEVDSYFLSKLLQKGVKYLNQLGIHIVKVFNQGQQLHKHQIFNLSQQVDQLKMNYKNKGLESNSINNNSQNDNNYTILIWPQLVILQEIINYDKEFLQSMIDSETYQIPPSIDTVLMSKACKGAIKFNEKLSMEQMKILVDNLYNCEFPFHCVHGRCSIHTFFSLESQDICQLQQPYHL